MFPLVKCAINVMSDFRHFPASFLAPPPICQEQVCEKRCFYRFLPFFRQTREKEKKHKIHPPYHALFPILFLFFFVGGETIIPPLPLFSRGRMSHEPERYNCTTMITRENANTLLSSTSFGKTWVFLFGRS